MRRKLRNAFVGTGVILAANDAPQDMETCLPGTGVILASKRCAARRGIVLAGNGGHSGGERCVASRWKRACREQGVILAANDAPQDAESCLPGTGGHPGGERCAARRGNAFAGNRGSALVVIWSDEFDGRCKEKIPRPAVLGSFCCDNDRREFPSIAVKPTALSADYLLSLPTETD